MPRLVNGPSVRQNVTIEFTPFEQDVLFTVCQRIGGHAHARDVFSDGGGTSLSGLLRSVGAKERADLLDDSPRSNIRFKSDKD